MVSGPVDPRDGSAALGMINVMSDLPKYTTAGGTLYVFSLPISFVASAAGSARAAATGIRTGGDAAGTARAATASSTRRSIPASITAWSPSIRGPRPITTTPMR